MYKIKSNDQRQIFDSHEFTFLKKVPAKGLDPASQALLNSDLLINKLQVLDRP